MPKLRRLLPTAVLTALLCASAAALADIRVGIDVSTTGPAASIGGNRGLPRALSMGN